VTASKSRRLPAENWTDVLEGAGFFVEGKPGAGILLAADLIANDAQIDRRTRYDAVIRKDKLGASAIYEISGAACIYFATFGDEPEPAELARRHQIAWNHGLAPLLWVITPTSVIIYDCFSPPQRRNDASAHIIRTFERTAQGLEALASLAGRDQPPDVSIGGTASMKCCCEISRQRSSNCASCDSPSNMLTH
jgi:hypothetical protein